MCGEDNYGKEGLNMRESSDNVGGLDSSILYLGACI